MGYRIEPLSIISFLDENRMRLPRFQRKATWDKKQNFELAISVFQDYPVGVVIVNKEQNISWLLDGRQRRNALQSMRNNPIELYEWARTYIGFAKNADEFTVKQEYWEKVEKYLSSEVNLEDDTNHSDDLDADEVNSYEDEEEIILDENSFDSQKQRKGLTTLLNLILMVHQNKPSGSKWQQMFDFTKYFDRLKYAPQKNNGKVDSVLLRRFILELIKDADFSNDGEVTEEYFIEYFCNAFTITDSDIIKFKSEVNKRWSEIHSSINTINEAEKIFAEARIGIIWLTNASPLDAQNIFSRINKGGTQLKAEELLSAKPYWNVEVQVYEPEVAELVAEMYSKLEVSKPESVVRWDISATLISRLKDQNLIFDHASYTGNNEISMDRVTLGFKLISSFYEQGMSSRSVIDLEKNAVIDWNKDITEMVHDINKICEILLATTFFKTLQAWKKPIAKLLGNAIALEFLTIIWLDWKDKGKPTVSSADLKAVQRDAKILFDRLVFEYSTKVWRGSGDSKMSNDIKNWRARIIPIDKNDWKTFIKGACEGIYNGQSTTVKLLKPVLYYYYALVDCLPFNQANTQFDVDHIIPQEIFKDNTMVSQELKDSLGNLALLPKRDNISKKSKRLNEITDPWLKTSIVTFTGILEKDFVKYSDVTNMPELKKTREKLFEVAFDTNRDAVLAN